MDGSIFDLLGQVSSFWFAAGDWVFESYGTPGFLVAWLVMWVFSVNIYGDLVGGSALTPTFVMFGVFTWPFLLPLTVLLYLLRVVYRIVTWPFKAIRRWVEHSAHSEDEEITTTAPEREELDPKLIADDVADR